MVVTLYIFRFYRRSTCVGLVALAVSGTTTHSQTVSGTAKPRLMIQGPAEQSQSSVIRDALGRPCLDIEAASRAHTVNRQLFDHVISIKNQCPKLVKVKVCYFNSDTCRSADVGGYRREDLILGTTTVTSFRYSIIQK